MRYVKIREVSYNEALLQLKREHGDDAIPISHKYVKEGGLFNSKFFAKDMVELTAAVQDRRPSGKPSTEKKRLDVTVGESDKSEALLNAIRFQAAGEKKLSSGTSVAEKAHAAPEKSDDLKNNIPHAPAGQWASDKYESAPAVSPVVSVKRETAAEKAHSGSDTAVFEKQIREIKDTLDRIAGDKPGVSDKVITVTDSGDALFRPYYEILKNNDYDLDEAAAIMTEVKNGISRDDMKDKYRIEKTFRELLMSRIVTTGPVKTGNKKKILMFVGPTGVGKTTTMAKLGAIYSLREGHSVSFITLDNYRIAATEQLKKYAEIMRIPVNAINDQKSFKEALAKDKSEIIMVDTSGRSHRNVMKISEIKSFADVVDYDFEKFLCVSANTKKRDLGEIFRAFEPVNYNSIIITKVDETSFLGNVVDVADKYNKPISYFTHGQEVPNDITVADPEKLTEMMVGNINAE